MGARATRTNPRPADIPGARAVHINFQSPQVGHRSNSLSPSTAGPKAGLPSRTARFERTSFLRSVVPLLFSALPERWHGMFDHFQLEKHVSRKLLFVRIDNICAEFVYRKLFV